METIQQNSGAHGRRIWLDVNTRVRISCPTVRRVNQAGLKLADLDLVLQYGERIVEGYYLSDAALNQALTNLGKSDCPALRKRLKQLRNLVVVEIMDTILATYRMQGNDIAEDEPLQREFVMH